MDRKLQEKMQSRNNQLMLLQALKDDGCVCDPLAKEYDEQETYEGGIGSRKAFTAINNRIISYHKVLETLTGERRANIRETIPVIDFVNSENTSLMSKYLMKVDNPQEINPSEIIRIPNDVSSDRPDSIDYILNEDESLINRVVTGSHLKSHFYNTLEPVPSEAQLQVASSTGTFDFTYYGIKFGKTAINDALRDSLQLSTIYSIWAGSEIWVYYDADASYNDPNDGKLPIANEESVVDDKHFILADSSTRGNLKLVLSKRDICVMMPSSDYAHNPVKLLVFKCHKDSTLKAPIYEPFIIYATKADPSDTFDRTEVGQPLPKYLTTSSILASESLYLDIKKNYYGEASGLLTGLFSYPDIQKDQNGNYTNNISRWIFANDTDRASANGVNISIGTKYFEGHLLDRGTIYDSPLKLTAHDPQNGYSGKATLAYDRIHSSMNTLFDPVLVNKTEWGNFDNHNLDYLVTEIDYCEQSFLQNSDIVESDAYQNIVNPKKLELLYPDIFRKSDGSSLKKQDITELISDYIHCFKGDTLYIDSKAGTNVCCSFEVKKNGGFDWGLIQKVIYSRDDGDLTASEFPKFIQESHLVRLKKGGGVINPVKNLYVKVRSLFDTFAKKAIHSFDGVELPESDGDTILIYPDSPKNFPEELYLISKVDLGLEEYQPLEQNSVDGNRGMCSFYNISEDKIISFRVAEVHKALLSEIKTFKVHDPYTGEWKSYPKEATEQYRMMLQFGQTNISNYMQKLFGFGNDNYIYILKPMSVSLSSVVLYDADDNPIDLQKALDNVSLVPMSHPKDFFAVSPIRNTDGTLTYVRKKENSLSELGSLVNSWIVPGLPRCDNLEELANYDHKGNKLKAFKDLMGSDMEGIKSIAIKNALEYVLFDWKLSNSDTNPIKLNVLPKVLDGVLATKECLQNLVKSKVAIPANDEGTEMTTLTSDMFKNFYDIIDKGRETNFYETKIAIPDATIDPSVSFAKNVETFVGGIDIATKFISSQRRESIVNLKKYLDNVFSGSEPISREDCEALDRCLGNDTKAFLCLSNNLNIDNLPNSISLGADKLIRNIQKYLKHVDESFKKATFEPNIITAYTEYFTPESAEAYVSKKYAYETCDTSILNFDFINISYLGELVIDSFLDNDPSFHSSEYKKTYETNHKKVPLEVSNLTKSELIFKYKLDQSLEEVQKGNTTRIVIDGFTDKTEEDDEDTEISDEFRYVSISERNAIVNCIRSIALDILEPEEVTIKEQSKVLSDSIIEDYMNDNLTLTETEASEHGKYILSIKFNMPDYADSTQQSLVPTGAFYEDSLGPYVSEDMDASVELLRKLAEYIKESLDGTTGYSSPVKYVAGDSKVAGRKDSLYYQRYCMLNNRMNTMDGALYKASLFLKLPDIQRSMKKASDIRKESYFKYMVTQPLVDMEPIMYLPPREKTKTTSALPSKFCYEKELEVLKSIINEKCILTCHKCKVQKSCPFYNEDELIRAAASSVKSIDLWLKDNELDLLVYDPESKDWPKAKSGNDVVNLSVEALQNPHKPYMDITHVYSSDNSMIQSMESNNLEAMRLRLRNRFMNFDTDCKGGIGWLLGARYGTVRNFHCLDSLRDQFPNEPMPDRTYMQDAVFITDEESDVVYAPSKNRYPVKVVTGKKSQRKSYEGSVRIKIPVGLKMFDTLNAQDDIYLVSDDETDSDGNPILPVIYLNTFSNLKYTFDLRDQSPENECLSADDPSIYPKDIAQWCVNYAKGICDEKPIDSLYEEHDQYWMEKIYKRDENNSWMELEGRPRYNSGYVENIISPESLTPMHVAIQKPLSANYVNFKRKLMISMDCVKWLKEDSSLIDSSIGNRDEAIAIAKEHMKSILPLMKTNLRLVAVRQPSTN